MLKNETERQEAIRTSMDIQIKQAMEALTKAGEGVWDQVRSQGADAAMGLVQDMRESHVDMVISLSQQVSRGHRGRDSDKQLRSSLSSLATEVSSKQG
jgi:hypothetical protein